MKAALFVAGLLLSAAVGAQTVYRCGPDGKTYSQLPCKEGKALDASDPRSAEQRETARQDAQREARAANALTRENRQREAQQAAAVRGQRPAGIRGVPEPAKAASAPSAKKPKKDKPPAGSKSKTRKQSGAIAQKP